MDLAKTLEGLSAAALEAVKVTEYKYFGDYELSHDEGEAVDTLVGFARIVTEHLRNGQLIVAQAGVQCVGCEGKPAPENNPCAVCGLTAMPSLAAKDVEIARLREALSNVTKPIGYLQRRAEAEGSRLNGMAYQIANDIAFVQSIARQALGDEA